MDTNALLEGFKQLKWHEQQALYAELRGILYPEEKDVNVLTPELREIRFPHKVRCPHCRAVKVKKHGIYRGRQRYLCLSKRCGRSFNDLTDSPISGTHYPDKWVQFLKLMAQSKTLPTTAMALDIHISTAFKWRHKVLDALRQLEKDHLGGIVEADETYFLESRKGKHRYRVDNPRKHGGKAEKRGLSNQQVAALIAIDRNGAIVSQVVGRGNTSYVEIDKAIGEHIAPGSILCTDAAKNYKAFAIRRKIRHEQLNPKHERVRGLYHIQHVNSYHSDLKRWIRNFNGISSKYLNNYLAWFRFFQIHKNKEMHAMKKQFLFEAFKSLRIA